MRRFAFALLVSTLTPSSALAAPPALPPPVNEPPKAAPSLQPSPTSSVQKAAAAPEDSARRGVVQVEQGGRPVAIGAVLARDGRVLTSLSALGTLTEPEIRYADGTVVKAKIGHKDKGWDLALLLPQAGRWLDGLVPTDADPASVELTAFLPAKTGKLAQSAVGYKGRVDAKSKEGDALRSVLDLDLKGSPAVPGAPLVDASGKVVGLLVRACKDAPAQEAKADAKADKPEAKSTPPACTPVTVAAPVYALRSFLVKTPETAVLPSPWLGLGGAPTEAGNVRGVRVVGVAAGSPAEKAGLKAGDAPDTIVAVDGAPVETPEQLADIIAKRAIGQTVKLLVYSAGKFRDVPVTLRAAAVSPPRKTSGTP